MTHMKHISTRQRRGTPAPSETTITSLSGMLVDGGVTATCIECNEGRERDRGSGAGVSLLQRASFRMKFLPDGKGNCDDA